MQPFPEYACAYAKKLAASSPRFALQISAKGEDADMADATEPGATESACGERGGASPRSADPFGELAQKPCPGLTQRFPDRVLVMTSLKCFMHCRHCTRRGILHKAENVSTPAALERCLAYVRERPAVRDVLLSGGDVLTLADSRVEEFVDAFASLEQIELVRVCTRALAANPARITRALVRLLRRAGRSKVWVNTQFNCADELTPAAVRAAGRLVDAGIPVSCQTVLLKGVNDSPDEMLELLRRLSAARIRPYYVFMCDPIAGIERFRVPLDRALEIERYCAAHIGGLAMPRFVADIPGAPCKMDIERLAAQCTSN